MIDRQCAHPIAIVNACKLHPGMAIANVSRSSPRQAQCKLVLLEHGSVASEYLAILAPSVDRQICMPGKHVFAVRRP